MNKINIAPLVTFLQEAMPPDVVANVIEDMLIAYLIYVLRDKERGKEGRIAGDVYFVHNLCKLLREAAEPPVE